jgi:exopolyphosphatase/pppGpp-phosphohydrolase
MNKKIYFFLILMLIIVLLVSNLISPHFCTEKRYAFDIGMGAIKSKASLVNHCKGVIVDTVGSHIVQYKFGDCIGKDNMVLKHCLNKGVEAVDEIEKHFGIKCGIDKCAGIATAWARKAENREEIIKAFRAKNVAIEIISQEREGELGYRSARAKSLVKRISEKNLIIWDVGAGSFQLSMLDENGKIHVYNGDEGIESFDRMLRRKYHKEQGEELLYLDGEQLQESMKYAAESLGKKVLLNPLIAKKLKEPKVRVFAMGRTMYLGLRHDLGLGEEITLADLEKVAQQFAGKTQSEIKMSYANLPEYFVRHAQSAVIFIYGIMKGAGVSKIHVIDATLNDYVLTEPRYWQETKVK